MIVTTSVTTARVIATMTSAEMIDVMISSARMTTTDHDINRKERSPPPQPKGSNPNGAFQSAN
jgi:hypothetical protein